MKILHITAHLGGGVGKAHSSLISADALFVRRHYVLLEEPRDTRYAESLVKSGATLTITPSKATILQLAAEADIVQIEWWNHPRLYHCLCENDWPVMRTLIWCHISGLTPPLIPPALLPIADRFMFTSPCSLALLDRTSLPAASRARIGVVNSGFGFTARQRRKGITRRDGSVAYLGTVNFSKMSRDFFSVVDDAGDSKMPVAIWGSIEDKGEVIHAANAMRRRERVRFMGHAADPASVLQEAQIFLYLLKQDHFGTAENALVEAMSCGCAPLVFPNTPELAIVTDGETGYVAENADDAARRLRWMRENPAEIEAIGRNAAEHVAATRLPVYSATAFARLYGELLVRQKRRVEFRAVLGTTAADWFMGTRNPLADDQSVSPTPGDSASKGTLSHFLSCYPQDESLLELAAASG
ncbi:glycosyltransferase [Ciceribacter sp. L1K22]|uniref:glycosyltransferase n=1 Tax=Ciceribacter sp. L1K22 TaxID=2820275 RepID=UPI001ABE091A|nr:glycosyltransferase [Ciceribacter sp. L1K22]MBO3762259.1 glycosyltransferase [Ciceribacter sp. L1K22]